MELLTNEHKKLDFRGQAAGGEESKRWRMNFKGWAAGVRAAEGQALKAGLRGASFGEWDLEEELEELKRPRSSSNEEPRSGARAGGGLRRTQLR